MIKAVGAAIGAMLAEMDGKTPKALREMRRKKFLNMGSKGLAA
jgi:acetyl-CoA carboxylase carboxyl transferase subunit alpha